MRNFEKKGVMVRLAPLQALKPNVLHSSPFNCLWPYPSHRQWPRCRIQRKTCSMGPYIGVDYNLTLQYVQSIVDSNTFTMGKPYMPESTLILCQSRLHPPGKDFGFHLNWVAKYGIHHYPYQPTPSASCPKAPLLFQELFYSLSAHNLFMGNSCWVRGM